MNEKLKIVYKKCGQTPLDCINEIKKENKELLHLPLTYAGRLDPLARGVLIILIGDECLKKDEYLKLGKVYETTIIFGFETDTYDLMGMVNKKITPSIPTKESFDFSGPRPPDPRFVRAGTRVNEEPDHPKKYFRLRCHNSKIFLQLFHILES